MRRASLMGCSVDDAVGMIPLQVWFQLGETGFFSNRVFPTDGLGTKEGWHYVYPVHEVPCSLKDIVITAC